MDYIAVYAAFLSTILALFEIYKWISKGPKLKGSARGNNLVTVPGDNKKYVRINVKNIGSEQTTITNLGIIAYEGLFKKFRNKPILNAVITNHPYSARIPLQLQIGNEAMYVFEQDQKIVDLSKGLLFVQVFHPFGDKPFLIRIPKIEAEK